MKRIGDRAGLAEAFYGVSFTWAIIELEAEDAIEQATSYVTRALAIFEELDDAPGIGKCEWALANVAWGARDIEGATVHALRSLEVFTSIDDRFNMGWANTPSGSALSLGLDSMACRRRKSARHTTDCSWRSASSTRRRT